jgi:hypothetical protein
MISADICAFLIGKIPWSMGNRKFGLLLFSVSMTIYLDLVGGTQDFYG